MSMSRPRSTVITICLLAAAGFLVAVAVTTATTGRTVRLPAIRLLVPAVQVLPSAGATVAPSPTPTASPLPTPTAVPSPVPTGATVEVIESGPDAWTVISSLGAVAAVLVAVAQWLWPRRKPAPAAAAAHAGDGRVQGG